MTTLENIVNEIQVAACALAKIAQDVDSRITNVIYDDSIYFMDSDHQEIHTPETWAANLVWNTQFHRDLQEKAWANLPRD